MGKDLNGKELGEYLSQKKDGRYLARFTDRFGRRPEYKSYDLKACRKWLKEHKALDTLNQNVIDESTKFEDYFYNQWLEIHKFGIIKENTKATYITHYRKHIKEYFGDKPLSSITTIQIKAFFKDEKKAGYKYMTINMSRKIIMDVLERALEDHLVMRNEGKGIKLIRDEQTEPRYLTEDEQRDFMEAAAGSFYYNLYMLMLGSGLRPGEAYALTEKDIDFENNVIYVNKTLIYQKWEHMGDTKKTFHLDGPKTYCSVREVPMSTMAREALQRQIKQKRVVSSKKHAMVSKRAAPKGFEDLLFTTIYDTPLESQIVNDAIDRILKEMNYTREEAEVLDDIHPHCFRHTFATRCIESGMNPKTLQKILGHATLEMTMNLYVHVTEERKVLEINTFNTYIDKIRNIPTIESVEPKRSQIEGEGDKITSKAQ